MKSVKNCIFEQLDIRSLYDWKLEHSMNIGLYVISREQCVEGSCLKRSICDKQRAMCWGTWTFDFIHLSEWSNIQLLKNQNFHREDRGDGKWNLVLSFHQYRALVKLEHIYIHYVPLRFTFKICSNFTSALYSLCSTTLHFQSPGPAGNFLYFPAVFLSKIEYYVPLSIAFPWPGFCRWK